MYTVVRKDIIEREESVPLQTLSGKDIFTCDLSDDDTLFQGVQPESWKNREFDILLVSELTGEIYHGRSYEWEDYKLEVKRFKTVIKEQMTYVVPLKATNLSDAEEESPDYNIYEPVATEWLGSVVMEISEEEFIKLGGKV